MSHYSSSSSSSLESRYFPKTPPPTTKSEDAAIKQCEGLSEALKKRVLDATSELSMDRCIIRNTRDSTCYSHVLSRATPEHIMTRLEYSWGMKFGQLNVDSSSNILRLSSDLHRLFQRCLWILVPEDPAILRSFRKHKKRGPVDNKFADLVPAGPYRYKFVSSHFLKRLSIIRQSESTGVSEATASNFSPERYKYPFLDFPTIVSHVHPRFVIYHAGRAFSKWVYDFCVAREDLRNSIDRIMSIYHAWTRPIPSHDIDSFAHVPKSLGPVDNSNDVDGENVSEMSSVTRAERYHWTRKDHRDNAEASTESLDRGTLLVFDTLVPHDTPTKDSVSRWLSEIPISPNEFDIDPISNIPLS